MNLSDRHFFCSHSNFKGDIMSHAGHSWGCIPQRFFYFIIFFTCALNWHIKPQVGQLWPYDITTKMSSHLGPVLNVCILECLIFSQWCIYRGNSSFVPRQWETSLYSNDVSHWLCAKLESPLTYVSQILPFLFLPYGETRKLVLSQDE